MKKRITALVLTVFLLMACVTAGSGEGDGIPPMPDAFRLLNVPFEGRPELHRQAFGFYSGITSAFLPGALGSGNGYVWEKYSITTQNRTPFDVYMIFTPDWEHLLAYAWVTSLDAQGAPDYEIAEAERAISAGFDGDTEVLRTGRLAEAMMEVSLTFDANRERQEMAAAELALQNPDCGYVTFYTRYDHYLTVIRAQGDAFWAIYHNTENLSDLIAEDASAREAENPVEDGETWTCENGHAGNRSNFCTECGAPRPKKTHSFCTECGQDLRGLNAKFCPNCGTPTE